MPQSSFCLTFSKFNAGRLYPIPAVKSLPACPVLARMMKARSVPGFKIQLLNLSAHNGLNLFSSQAKCKKCRLLGKHPRDVDEQVGNNSTSGFVTICQQKVNEQLALTVDWSVLDCSLCGAFCSDAVLLPCCGPSTQVPLLSFS